MNICRTSALVASSVALTAGVAGGVAWAGDSGSDEGNAGGRVAPARTTTAKGPAEVLSAQVGGDHTKIRGRGFKKVVDDGTGVYRVRFNRSVAECVFTGSLTDDSTAFGSVGFISLATDGSSPNGVFVETRDSSGDLADSDFSLLVVC